MGILLRIDIGKADPELLNEDPKLVIEEFLSALEASGADEKTIKSYRAALYDFFNFINWKNLRNITGEDIRRWRLERLRKGFQRAKTRDRRSRQVTLYYYTLFLKRFFEWLGLDIAIPRVRKPKRNEVETLKLDEVMKLFEASRDRLDLLILALLLETGLRANEALSLRFADIDLANREIRVRNAKFGEERTVFIGPLTYRLLVEEINIHKPHPDEKVIPLSYTGLYKRLKSLAKRAGINTKKIRPHVLRHTFATEALKRGLNIIALQRILGHKDLKTTQIYLHMLKEDLKAQYFKIFGINPTPIHPYNSPNTLPTTTGYTHTIANPGLQHGILSSSTSQQASIPYEPILRNSIQQGTTLEIFHANPYANQGLYSLTRNTIEGNKNELRDKTLCPNCKKPIPRDARFCPYCGMRIV